MGEGAGGFYIENGVVLEENNSWVLMNIQEMNHYFSGGKV